jgi:thioredoxin-like negative regulator of GroEL
MTYRLFHTANKFVPQLNPAVCFGQLVDAYAEYQRVVQEERTKRREIAAWEKAALTTIEQRRDVMMQFLDRAFNERAENFREFFALADQAIATGDNDQLAAVLTSIVELAKTSPFKDLADLTKVEAALDDPDHTWEF